MEYYVKLALAIILGLILIPIIGLGLYAIARFVEMGLNFPH